MAALSTGIDSLPLEALIVAVMLPLLAFGALALVVAWRVRSDNRAAASARRVRTQQPTELPRNFAGGWDRVDEYGRPW